MCNAAVHVDSLKFIIITVPWLAIDHAHSCTATSHADNGTRVVTSSNWVKYIKHTGTKCSYRVLRVPKPMTNTSHPTAERATSGSISYWEKTRTLLSFLSKLIKWGYNFYLFSVRNHRSDGKASVYIYLLLVSMHAATSLTSKALLQGIARIAA